MAINMKIMSPTTPGRRERAMRETERGRSRRDRQYADARHRGADDHDPGERGDIGECETAFHMA